MVVCLWTLNIIVNMNSFLLNLIILASVLGGWCNDINKFEEGIYKDAIDVVRECGDNKLTLCLKENALHYIDRLPANFNIGDGIMIKENMRADRNSRYRDGTIVLPKDSMARENMVDGLLLERIADFFATHTFELKMPSSVIKDLNTSVDEARKKKGDKKNNMMPYLILLKLKAATIAAIALKTIALVAFKALIVGKVALTISLIIALKKLFHHKDHSSTYEIVAHPHYEDYGHYERALNNIIKGRNS